jgi:hypothetical protein
MKYLCLIYSREQDLDALSPSEVDTLIADSLAYDEELRRSGHFVAAQALEPVHAATTLRVRNGRISTTDGPFTETKEQLAGFVLIEASDLNEAIQVAAQIPSARVGSVEVRPIRELPRRR